MFITHWKLGEPVLNYGEALIYLLADAMGIQLEPLLPGIQVDHAWMWIGSELCLGGNPDISSTLDYALKRARNVHIWGQGNGRSNEGLPEAIRDRVRLWAVRGPLTAKQNRFDGPQGDPGFLLPAFMSAPAPGDEVLYIPHHSRTREESPEPAETLSIMVPNDLVAIREMVERIARARKVITSSLHVWITARAFGVWTDIVTSPPMPRKWEDVHRWWYENRLSTATRLCCLMSGLIRGLQDGHQITKTWFDETLGEPYGQAEDGGNPTLPGSPGMPDGVVPDGSPARGDGI